jgi:hypothetical protein
MAKLRKLGDVLLDLEPLLDEMVEGHSLQLGDVISLIVGHLRTHNPDCIEEFLDGTNPILTYAHKDNSPKKEIKYPQDK